MRDRLIKLLETDVECNKDGHGDCSMCEYKYADDKCAHYLSNIIADFLLANGVIVPPVSVGQTVYRKYWNGGFVKCTVSMITQKADKSFKIRLSYNGSVGDYTEDDFGKTVFLTKEEAEAELVKRSKTNA